MVKLKREVSASLFRCTHRNSIARSVPDISRMFPDYPGSFLIVITFSVKSSLPPTKSKFPPYSFAARRARAAWSRRRWLELPRNWSSRSRSSST